MLAKLLFVLIMYEFKVCIIFQDEETPLHNACSRGHLECAQALIEAGAKCNIRDKVTDW